MTDIVLVSKMSAADEEPICHSSIKAWKRSKTNINFFDLPQELRDQIYGLALEDARTKFCFDRETGRRVFIPQEPVYPRIALAQTSRAVRRELGKELYRSSEVHVQVWTRHLTQPNRLDFKNLDFNHDVDGSSKLKSFRRLRFSVGESLDLAIEQSNKGKSLKLTHLTVPLFLAPEQWENAYGIAVARIITDAIKLIAVRGGFTPAVAKQFVLFLIDLVVKLADWAWEMGVIEPDFDIIKYGDDLSSEAMAKAKGLLVVGSEWWPRVVVMSIP